jgi:aminopeptidase N
VATESPEGLSALEKHYYEATNMTDEVHGLQQYILTGVPLEHDSIQKFYQKWKHDSLVMLKWFSSIAAFSPKAEAAKRIQKLEKDPLYLKEVPNYLRALYLQFAKNNLVSFHDVEGEGYRLIAERIKHIDSFNPQVASRTSSAFSMINKLDDKRKSEMKKALEIVMSGKPSRDTFEVISKYLAE